MNRKFLTRFSPLLVGILLLASGCQGDGISPEQETSIDTSITAISYTDSDYYTNWQESEAAYIHLDGKTASVDGNSNVVVDSQKISIYQAGTYVIDGALDDGQIIVDAKDAGDVRIVLNNVSIHSSTNAPIFVKQADKTIISLEEGTENTLSDAAEYVYEENAEDGPSATLYSKDDLTINGSGTLNIMANFNDGIKSNDDLKITGGSITITAKDDGIIGKDLLAVKDAEITITAGGDGLKSSNTKDDTKGNIFLESGTFSITADGDGFQAEKNVTIVDGEYSITTGGGSPEVIETNSESFGGAMGNREPGNFSPPNGGSPVDQLLEGIDIPEELENKLDNIQAMEELQSILQDYPDVLKQIQENMPKYGGPDMGNRPTGEAPPQRESSNTSSRDNLDTNRPTISDNSNKETKETTDDSVSTKGIKAGTSLHISGGKITIDSLDDAIHSNQDVLISGGDLTISTGDDGIHGDQNVALTDGNISIEKSYEGIEGINITITDGTYSVVSEDDGINANGSMSRSNASSDFEQMSPQGNSNLAMENADDNKENEEIAIEEGILSIQGGYLVVNANGDGVDSNTSIEMTGGTLIVYGPTSNGDAPIDYDGEFIMTGGVLIASGSSGMAQGISEESSQPALMMNYSESQEAGTTVYMTDQNGKEIIAVTPEKAFQSIIISTPDLQTNQNYTFQSGGVLTGTNHNGLYQQADYKEGTLSIELPLSTIMTYADENGITEGNSNHMMNGRPPMR